MRLGVGRQRYTGPDRSRRARWPSHSNTALLGRLSLAPVCRKNTHPMQCRGAKSFVDDLGLSRGVVVSRAAALLRSIETKPFDSKICPLWTGKFSVVSFIHSFPPREISFSFLEKFHFHFLLSWGPLAWGLSPGLGSPLLSLILEKFHFLLSWGPWAWGLSPGVGSPLLSLLLEKSHFLLSWVPRA